MLQEDTKYGGSYGAMAELRRGMYTFDEDGKEEEFIIKAGFFICTKCWLEDPDLCRFFNKIGWRTR